MGMRARVFDDWIRTKIQEDSDSIIIHIGCGLDSRVERVGTYEHSWYDVDFPEVIEERRLYYSENERYKMLGADIRQGGWLELVSKSRAAIVVMEGVSMYLTYDELSSVLSMLCSRFDSLSILMDCYNTFAAKASKIKNPINGVGVTRVYGIDNPRFCEVDSLVFIKEHNMTPDNLTDQLLGMEKGCSNRFTAEDFHRGYINYSNLKSKKAKGGRLTALFIV